VSDKAYVKTSASWNDIVYIIAECVMDWYYISNSRMCQIKYYVQFPKYQRHGIVSFIYSKMCHGLVLPF